MRVQGSWRLQASEVLASSRSEALVWLAFCEKGSVVQQPSLTGGVMRMKKRSPACSRSVSLQRKACSQILALQYPESPQFTEKAESGPVTPNLKHIGEPFLE